MLLELLHCLKNLQYLTIKKNILSALCHGLHVVAVCVASNGAIDYSYPSFRQIY